MHSACQHDLQPTACVCRFLKFSVQSATKYFSLEVICEDRDAIKHGQTYVVGMVMFCLTRWTEHVQALCLATKHFCKAAHTMLSMHAERLHTA